MRRSVVLASAAVPLVVAALTACSQPTPLPLPTATTAATPAPTVDPRLTVQAVAGLAVRQVGAGTVTAVHDESAGTVWDVRVVAATGEVQEVHLAADDGRVLAGPSAEPAGADQRSTNRALVAAAAVTLDGAARRMLAAVPRGRITAIELAPYQDRVVWRGDVLNADGVRQDVRIDAVNGSVLLNLTDGQRSSGGS